MSFVLLSAYSSDYFSRVHQLPETDLHHHLGDLQHPRREIPRQARCHPLTSTHPFRPTNRAKSSTLSPSAASTSVLTTQNLPSQKARNPVKHVAAAQRSPPNSATPPIPDFACLIGSSIP
ncbi:hypothetical protein CGCS363_v014660 [Colletotrichum siamense]|uniref:uncharacterized protein n=1 Tax=Colletotrichum siamense TaxID=690259 RepID=UPI0018728183|nr:uncharacterized protein CGCS363_v014660 [Colletotrichum siamense]KAF5484857.1 hypothetical protein CGCS363_v014660 [Colletotrichum siamense]